MSQRALEAHAATIPHPVQDLEEKEHFPRNFNMRGKRKKPRETKIENKILEDT